MINHCMVRKIGACSGNIIFIISWNPKQHPSAEVFFTVVKIIVTKLQNRNTWTHPSALYQPVVEKKSKSGEYCIYYHDLYRNCVLFTLRTLISTWSWLLVARLILYQTPKHLVAKYQAAQQFYQISSEHLGTVRRLTTWYHFQTRMWNLSAFLTPFKNRLNSSSWTSSSPIRQP